MAYRAYRWLISSTLLILLGACAQFPTTNQDPAKNNKANYNKEMKECQEDYPQTSAGVHVRQWISCMNLKGWS